MTRDELEHGIRAASDVVGDTELWVFGSQSILGDLPNAPASLRTSIEVDMDPKNRPDLVDHIDGARGEGSQFHRTHGFYVHGVSIATATLPQGWQARTKPVKNANTADATGWCLDLHDLAASKLAAFRDKDREFVRVMLRERFIDPKRLARLIDPLPLSEDWRMTLRQWAVTTATELSVI